MRPFAPAILLLLLIPGCAGPEASGTAATAAPGTSATPAATGSPSSGASIGPAPAILDLVQDHYLTAQMQLQAAKPEAGSVAVPAQLDSSGQVPSLTFQGAPLAAPAILPGPAAQLTLFLRTELPVPSNQQFDLAAWLGSARGTPLAAITAYPAPANLPGTFRLDLELEWGTLAPPVLASGDALQVMVAALGDVTGSGLRLLVGGEEASFLRVRTAGLAADPLGTGRAAEERLSGHVTGAGSVNCAMVPELQVQTHAIEVAANATWLAIAAEPAVPADLDLYLSDGSALLSQGNTPSGRERLFVAGAAAEALQGKSLRLDVFGCSGGPVDYALTVQQGQP